MKKLNKDILLMIFMLIWIFTVVITITITGDKYLSQIISTAFLWLFILIGMLLIEIFKNKTHRLD